MEHTMEHTETCPEDLSNRELAARLEQEVVRKLSVLDPRYELVMEAVARLLDRKDE